MKRFFVLILAILYMGSSTGATFRMHYCMGELVKVQLWNKDTNKCSKCGAGEASNKACSKKCCRDEHKTVKLEKEHKTAEQAIHFMPLPAAVPAFYTGLPQVYTVSLPEAYPTGNAPPRSSKVHPHIFNCSFRI